VKRRLYIGFLACLWVVCLYRAITQSIVHDEALTYELYIAAPLSRVFSYFDANHHFLNTLLMRLSVMLFGVSEWALRLPALAGAALYFAAVYQIAVNAFRTSAASALAVALLTLNPLVLDFLVAARGYGIALALFTYALALLVRWEQNEKDRRPASLVKAGIALGLSVAANLVFAVPVFAVVVAALVLAQPRRVMTPAGPATPAAGRLHKKLRRRKVAAGFAKPAPNPAYRYLLAPLAAVGLLFFIAAPIAEASASQFYVGSASVVESLRSLASASLAHSGFLRTGAFTRVGINAVAFILAPITVAAALLLGWQRRGALLLLTGGVAAGSAAILLLAHALWAVPFPVDRTGIYFLVLAPLAMTALVDAEIAKGPFQKVAAGVLYCLALALVVRFAAEFNVRSFLVWDYDADTRQIAGSLARLANREQPDSIRVGASWQLEPSLNFYRDKNQLTWMLPVERGSLAPGASFYVLMAADRAVIGTLGLKPIQEWPQSGSILAVPPGPAK
jgi:Dolichyl-phosphate-mannose-protein mannosyltransferase